MLSSLATKDFDPSKKVMGKINIINVFNSVFLLESWRDESKKIKV
jgi:hypothetical protein